VAQVAPACSERGRASQRPRCPETERPSGETVVHSTQVAVQQGDGVDLRDGVDLLRLATAVPLRLCDGEDDERRTNRDATAIGSAQEFGISCNFSKNFSFP